MKEFKLQYKKIWTHGHNCVYVPKKFKPPCKKFFKSSTSKLKLDIIFNRMGKQPMKKDYFFLKMRLGKSP